MAAPAAATTARNVMKHTDLVLPAATPRTGRSTARSAAGATPGNFFAKLSRARQDARPRPATETPPHQPEPTTEASKPAKPERQSNKAEPSRQVSRPRGRKDSARTSDESTIDETTTKTSDASLVGDSAPTITDETATTDSATTDDQPVDESVAHAGEPDPLITVDPALLPQLTSGANATPVDTVDIATIKPDDTLSNDATAVTAKAINGGIPVVGEDELTPTGSDKGPDADADADADSSALTDGAIDLSKLTAVDEPASEASDFGAKLARHTAHHRSDQLDADENPDLDTDATTAQPPAAANDVATTGISPTGTSPTAPTPTDAPTTLDPSLAGMTMTDNGPTTRATSADARPAAVTAAPRTPTDAEFAQANHAKIVGAMNGGATATGGSMQIRLDPPHLGPMSVAIHMRDGVVTASFETQNDDATRLLSHSLGQLKSSLEAQGISVDRLQVQQAPRDQAADNNTRDEPRQNGNGQGPTRDALSDQQQQQRQRQETLRRMWSRINGDPIDLVA
jgi:flagellar hook-length control protein FliK